MKYKFLTVFFITVLITGAFISVTTPVAGEKQEGAVKKKQAVSVESDIDIETLFCDSLYQEATYESGKYKSYKMLIPGDDGWIFRTSRDLGTDFLIDTRAQKYLSKIQSRFQEKGITFVMLYAPTRGLVHNDVIRDKEKKKYGFTDINAVWNSYHDAVKSTKEGGINIIGLPKIEAGSDFFYKRDHHWNQSGAKMSAIAVANEIKNMLVYEGLAKTEYVTREVGPYDFYGTSDKVFKKICNTDQPAEKIIQVTTEKADLAEGADDLFGEASEPEVVLMGTSNSTIEPSYSNFEGFLKEQLKTDILNMSVSGGGIDTAFMSYLNSDHYKKGKAKLVIWEVPGYYDLNKHFGMFRQVIPAISNDCGKDALQSNKVKLKGETSIVLEDMEKMGISGDNYYVYLKFNKPVKERFSVDFRYIKNRDKYKLKRSKRYPHDNEFYLGLKASKKADLEKVVLEIPKKMEGLEVEAKLCKVQ